MCEFYLNGNAVKEIAINDRGLLYGDGFFSTLKIVNGCIERWPLHLERISFSADKLSFPAVEIEQLQKELASFIESQDRSDGCIRLTITRGSGERGYQAPDKPQISRILSWSPLMNVDALQQGVTLNLDSRCQISINPLLSGVKHLNRLDQVLAQNYKQVGCFDTIMLADDLIISGSKTNIYFHVNDRWVTPKLNKAGVNGTVRRWLLATQDDFHSSSFGLDILKIADYCLVSNALIGIIPVTNITINEKKPKEYGFDIYPKLPELQNAYRENALYRLENNQ